MHIYTNDGGPVAQTVQRAKATGALHQITACERIENAQRQERLFA